MPNYDFKCEKCNKIFEVYKTVNKFITDNRKHVCDCGEICNQVYHPQGIKFIGRWEKTGGY